MKHTSEAAFETVIESHLLANGYATRHLAPRLQVLWSQDSIVFGTDFNQPDQLFFDQIVETAVVDDGLRQATAVPSSLRGSPWRVLTCIPAKFDDF